MSSRTDRREKLRAKMQHDAANVGKKGGKNSILDFTDFEDVSFYKTVKGKNELDIFPFEITTKNDPEGTSVGSDNYKLEFHQHSNIGPEDNRVLCILKTFGKPCPICEERDRLIAELDAQKVAEPWKNKEVKALQAKRRCLYNVIDLNATEKGMQIFEHNWAHFEKELFLRATYKNPAFCTFADFEEGYSIEFRGADSDFSDKYIEPKDFDFSPRDPYDEKDIREQTYPFDAMLIIPNYDEVQAMFMGVELEDEKEEPKEEKPKATRKKKTTETAPRTTAKEGREAPARSRRSKPEEEKQPDIPDCYAGHAYGEDWDTKKECEGCEHFDACADQYELMEKLAKEAEEKKKEETKEEAPTTRRRSKRR